MNDVTSKYIDLLPQKEADSDPFHFKDFLIKQGELDVRLRRQIRSDPHLASVIFGIPFDGDMACGYYFWDNTTLSLVSPLNRYIVDGGSVLEIGPGPAATLSRYLANTKSRLKQTCAEIDSKFAKSCENVINKTRSTIRVVETDMTKNISDTFDIVFMNPPYVPANKLNSLEIVKQTQEFQAGYGGRDGGDIVRQFLGETPKILNKDGYAILGINNLYLSDEHVMDCINDCKLSLHEKYYPADSVPPFSQVYILTLS